MGDDSHPHGLLDDGEEPRGHHLARPEEHVHYWTMDQVVVRELKIKKKLVLFCVFWFFNVPRYIPRSE